MNLNNEIGFSKRAFIALLKKSEFVTPETTLGYCIPKNSPALLLSSTDICSTSFPSNVIEPDVTVYFGFPIMAASNVDLPFPLGPIRA